MMDPIPLEIIARTKAFPSLYWRDEKTLVVCVQQGKDQRWLEAQWDSTAWVQREITKGESTAPSEKKGDALPDPRIVEVNGRGQIYWQESLCKELADFTDVRACVIAPGKRFWAVHAAAPALVPQILIFDVQTKILHPIATALDHNPRPRGARPLALQWPSLDGEIIHGWFYTPEVRSQLKPPLIVLVHDGPHICVRETWPIKARLLTSRGYAVLYVNYRGSSGYGLHYEQALAAHWGERDVWDVVSGRRHLAEQGFVDSKRTAVWGGRFGGATVLNTLAQFPGEFQAGIAVYPLCDLETAITRANAKTKEKWARLIATRSIDSISPLNRAENIVDPIYVFHGGKDPFTPVESISTLLNKMNGEKYLTVYPELGERFLDQNDWRDYYERTLKFLEERLHPEHHRGRWYRDYSHEMKLLRSPALRWTLMGLSSIFLLLGIVGIFLPILPTTPFLLLAAACYARSSTAFYNRLMNHRFLGPPLRQWKETRTIPRPVKFLAIGMLLGTLVPSTILFVPILGVQIGLVLFAVIMSIIITRIPSRRDPSLRSG